MLKGFSAPRGTYGVVVTTSRVKDDQEDSSKGGMDAGGEEVEVVGPWRPATQVEDHWVVSYVLAPPSVSSGFGDDGVAVAFSSVSRRFCRDEIGCMWLPLCRVDG